MGEKVRWKALPGSLPKSQRQRVALAQLPARLYAALGCSTAVPPAVTRDLRPPAAAHSQSAGATSDSPKTKSLLFTRNLSNDISGRLTHTAYVLCIISVFLQYSKLKTIIKITKKIIKRKNIYTVLDNIK